MDILHEMAQKLGHKVLALAPYSPELNPIEQTWANIKRYMQNILPCERNFIDTLMSCFYFN
ncbi:transposase [Moraxella sp. ZY21109]